MAISNHAVNDLSGIQIPSDACVVIIRTEWNAHIVDLLEEGCTHILSTNKVPFSVVTIPGAFEISFSIKHYWEQHKYRESKPAAFIALGCVLRGDTPHFDYVCKSVTDGITQLNLSLPIPTIFGILTVDNQEQADARTTGIHGNKGAEAAITALKMIAFSKETKKY